MMFWAVWWKWSRGCPSISSFKERLFQPLGMKDTYFFPPEEKVPRLATAYAYDEQKGLRPILDDQVMGGRRVPVHGGLSLPRPAHLFLRRRRALLHGGGLLPLLPDDAERRRTERGAHPQPQVRRIDEPQSRARQTRRRQRLRPGIWNHSEPRN